jgi:hypothetical protein
VHIKRSRRCRDLFFFYPHLSLRDIFPDGEGIHGLPCLPFFFEKYALRPPPAGWSLRSEKIHIVADYVCCFLPPLVAARHSTVRGRRHALTVDRPISHFAGAIFSCINKKSFGKQKVGVFVSRYENKLVSGTKKGCFCSPNVIE